jgi:3-methyladenine DNA glycosylase/8-oxoguanine DNA glycosylase
LIVVETTLRARGPYSLALSARRASDTTRRFRGGVLTCVLARGEQAAARQLPDGSLVLRADTEAGIDQLRFVLGVDDDHTPFLDRFREDELLARPVRHLKGLRPIRTATVTHALLRAIVGQLITSREARAIEWRLIRATTERVGELQAPPLPHHFAGFAPAELYPFRLPARKATALVRICRTFDPERLRRLPPDGAAARLEQERGIGPYSIGVVWTQGLGRFDRGIVGDLGLLKVCSAIEGRWVDSDDTARLLERYGEWAGLACVYLMAGASRGLVPLKLSPPEVRRERIKARYAA